MSIKMLIAITAGVLVIGAIVYVGAAMYIDDVEHPTYRTVVTDGDIEVRAYGPMVVAEVTKQGERDNAVSRAFSPLANYIFAKDRSGETISMTAPVTQQPVGKIAMTAPVTQAPSGEPGEWVVRFVMPSKFNMKDLPKPASGEVELKRVPASEKAVIRFSGRANDAAIAEHETQLKNWIAAKGYKATSQPTYAYYNSPFTPWFMRRNEVMIDIEGTKG